MLYFEVFYLSLRQRVNELYPLVLALFLALETAKIEENIKRSLLPVSNDFTLVLCSVSTNGERAA